VVQVYQLLSALLPDFGPENWTSELRSYYPGLEPFTGSSPADFTYADCQGILTAKLFDDGTRANWNGRWPKYLLEVKSTSREEQEPFHMSQSQLQHVGDFYSFCVIPSSHCFCRLPR
jgi:hypothetical protein